MDGIKGLTFDCKILPDPIPSNVEMYWFLDANDFPEPQHTKITWEPYDVKNNRPHVGVGTSPKLKVTYENPQSKYVDFMPPDNRWFGQKKITVKIGNDTIATQPIWFFFNPTAERTIRGWFGKTEQAWFHYWKESGAVLALEYFEYNASLANDVAAKYSNGQYYIGPKAQTSVQKPDFDVNNPNSYNEVSYPNNQGIRIHAVAKYCIHELWHGELEKEILVGRIDSDNDGLNNIREAEIGTNPNVKDTCGLSSFMGGGANYSNYANYADEELFCRWQQDGKLGDISKDWSAGGMQSPQQGN
jgi:hypothetical protein